MNTAYLRFTEQ